MKWGRFFTVLGAFVGIAVVTVVSLKNPADAPTNKPVVVASAYPLAYFAKALGGDTVIVETITPYGVEPHDYEPTVGERVKFDRANAFLYVGSGFDPWAERYVAGGVREDMIVRSLLPSSEYVESLLPVHEALAASPRAKEEDGEAGAQGLYDPHAWLDPVRAKIVVDEVAAVMISLDDSNRSLYEARASELLQRLEALNVDFEQGLASCKTRSLIASHDAYGYLEDRYGLSVIPIAGISPEAEPSPGTIAEIVRNARGQGVTTVFFETIVDPRVAETIAREIGGETKVLNPIENLLPEEAARDETYFTIMEQNLVNLQQALMCRE